MGTPDTYHGSFATTRKSVLAYGRFYDASGSPCSAYSSPAYFETVSMTNGQPDPSNCGRLIPVMTDTATGSLRMPHPTERVSANDQNYLPISVTKDLLDASVRSGRRRRLDEYQLELIMPWDNTACGGGGTCGAIDQPFLVDLVFGWRKGEKHKRFGRKNDSLVKFSIVITGDTSSHSSADTHPITCSSNENEAGRTSSDTRDTLRVGPQNLMRRSV